MPSPHPGERLKLRSLENVIADLTRERDQLKNSARGSGDTIAALRLNASRLQASIVARNQTIQNLKSSPRTSLPAEQPVANNYARQIQNLRQLLGSRATEAATLKKQVENCESLGADVRNRMVSGNRARLDQISELERRVESHRLARAQNADLHADDLRKLVARSDADVAKLRANHAAALSAREEAIRRQYEPPVGAAEPSPTEPVQGVFGAVNIANTRAKAAKLYELAKNTGNWKAWSSANSNWSNFPSKYQDDVWLRSHHKQIVTKLATKLGRVFSNVIINDFRSPAWPSPSPADFRLELKGQRVDVVSGAGVAEFGPFYTLSEITRVGSAAAAFDAAKGQAKPGDPSIADIVDTAVAGGSVVLFGYGFSGSGKTFCLLGDNKDKTKLGFMQKLLQEAQQRGARVSLESIFELYGVIDAPLLADGKGLSLQNRNSRTTDPTSYAIRPSIQVFDVSSARNRNVGGMYDTIFDIAYDSSKRHISSTPNNPASSRGHLFVVVKVVSSGQTGYMTFVDSAGAENAPSLLATILKAQNLDKDSNGRTLSARQFQALTYDVFRAVTLRGKQAVGAKVSQIVRMTQPYDVVRTLREGFFINETLNNMRVFFRSRGSLPDIKQPGKDRFGLVTVPKTWSQDFKYTTDHTFVDTERLRATFPKQTSLTDILSGAARDPGDPTRMCQILNALAGLGNTSLFSMVAVVNPSVPYGAQEAATRTLSFAQSLYI